MIPYHPPRAARAIAVIDLTGAFSAELAQREAVAADIHKACRETLMQRWTKDLYRSNVHRVKNNHATRARYSVPFFHTPRPSALIECLPTCTDGQHPPKYAPCTAGEHRAEMFRRSYDFAPTS
jgi:isopenicillin N synthase-like dioxygenase